MEPENHNGHEESEVLPTDDSPTDWFNMGCSLATTGKPVEAERALKIAINAQEEYPIAWAILSAVLLSQGRETDAEKAGKMALDQCKDLKMTWSKLRSIMFIHAIQRGEDWKSPRRVRFEISDTTEWGITLSKLSESSNETLDKIEAIQEETFDPDIIVEHEEEITDEEVALTVMEDIPTSHKVSIDGSRSAEVWFSLARDHMNAKEYDKAEEAYMSGLTLNPENGDALLRVGSLLMRRNAYDKAEDSLVLAVKYIPQDPDAWLQLGICLQESERWVESVDALKMAKDLNPQNPEVWVKLGEADYFRSLYQEAARSFLRALRINPDHIYALFYLGRCMEYRGNENHALRIYNKLLNINPKNPEILEELAKSFHRLGSTNDAQRAKSLASYHRRSKL